MELYQGVAIAVMIALGVVVHTTMKLNGLRKDLKVERTLINVRDLEVMRHPQRYDSEEVRLVRTTWLACATAFALVMLLLAVSPQEVMQKF